MPLYVIALFVHLVGLIALFSAFAVLQRGGAQLRRAETVEQVRSWVGLLRQTPPMFMAGSIILLVSGLYMAGQRWGFAQPWIAVALAGLVAIGVLTGAVYSPRLEAVERAASSAEPGPAPPDLVRRIAEPGLWISVTAMNGAAIGIVWLMVTKPGWTGSIVAMLVAGMLGAGVGAVIVRRSRTVGEARPTHSDIIQSWQNRLCWFCDDID